MTDAEHLPDKKVKSDTDLVIDSFVDRMLQMHPSLDRVEFHEKISSCVHEHLPDEDEGEEDEGEEDEP